MMGQFSVEKQTNRLCYVSNHLKHASMLPVVTDDCLTDGCIIYHSGLTIWFMQGQYQGEQSRKQGVDIWNFKKKKMTPLNFGGKYCAFTPHVFDNLLFCIIFLIHKIITTLL